MLTTIGTEPAALEDLEPFPGNARRGDVDLILNSLRANGQYKPLTVRRHGDTLTVLAGNHTLLALIRHEEDDRAGCADWELSHDRPCQVCIAVDKDDPTALAHIIECDDATATRINLVDNRAADVGDYDQQALAAVIASLEDDLVGTGFEPTEAELFADGAVDVSSEAVLDLEEQERQALLTDPDEVPEPPAAPISKPGDVWCLGPHRLLCGDSTDKTAVGVLLEGGLADCMWTDPPYGVDYVGGTKDALTIQNDGAEGLLELLAGAFTVATNVLKPGAPVYVAHPPGPLALQFASAFLEAGWLLRQNLVWVKNSLVLGRSDYHYRHEPIMYGFTEAPVGSGRLGRGGDRWFGDHAQTSVFEIPKPLRSEDHPTMKPVDLVTRCLANSCPPGGSVYEPFGGSGTTLIAAHSIGRVARVVEIDPKYVDVICKRYQEVTGDKPVLERTGKPHDFLAGEQR